MVRAFNYEPGIRTPLDAYTGGIPAFGSDAEIWDLIRKHMIDVEAPEVKWNPQSLMTIPFVNKPEVIQPTVTPTVIPTVVKPWVDPDDDGPGDDDDDDDGPGDDDDDGPGDGTNGTDNGTNGTNGNGVGDTTGLDIGDVTGNGDDESIVKALAESQALAQALADEQALADAQALADQEAADNLAAQQIADAQAASDALLLAQQEEAERQRNEAVAEALAEAEEAERQRNEAAAEALTRRREEERQRNEAAAEAAAAEAAADQEAAEAAAEALVRQNLEDSAYASISTDKERWGRKHWEAHGKNAGRDLPGNFGDYVDSYPDLSSAYLDQSLLQEPDDKGETIIGDDEPLLKWGRKSDGSYGWIPSGIGISVGPWDVGTNLAGAHPDEYPYWIPDNPYAIITPDTKGWTWIHPLLSLPRTYQQWNPKGRSW